MQYYHPSEQFADMAWEMGRSERSSPRQALISRGIAAYVVDRVLSGKRVSYNTALNIAKELNVPINALFTEDGESHSELDTVVITPQDLEESAVTDMEPPNIPMQTAPRGEFVDRFESIVAHWKQYLAAVGCHSVADVRSGDMQNFILMVGRGEEETV